jgi:ribosomal protein L37AE/L43A
MRVRAAAEWSPHRGRSGLTTQARRGDVTDLEKLQAFVEKHPEAEMHAFYCCGPLGDYRATVVARVPKGLVPVWKCHRCGHSVSMETAAR